MILRFGSSECTVVMEATEYRVYQKPMTSGGKGSPGCSCLVIGGYCTDDPPQLWRPPEVEALLVRVYRMVEVVNPPSSDDSTRLVLFSGDLYVTNNQGDTIDTIKPLSPGSRWELENDRVVRSYRYCQVCHKDIVIHSNPDADVTSGAICMGDSVVCPECQGDMKKARR